MKYLLVALMLLSCCAFAQSLDPSYKELAVLRSDTKTRVTFVTGSSMSSTNSSIPTNYQDAHALGLKQAQECKCEVMVKDIAIYYGQRLKYSSSKSSSSSSKSSSSVASSVSLTTLSLSAPTCRELKPGQTACTPLALSEIKEYELTCGARLEKIKSTGANIEYTTAYIAPGTECLIATRATDNQLSKQIKVEDSRQ